MPGIGTTQDDPSSRLAHPFESAGRLALSSVPAGQGEETLATVRVRLHSRRYDILDVVFVLDAGGRYVGVADLRDVLNGPDEGTLASVLRHGWPSVPPELDQERAAAIAGLAGVAVLPVVTADRELVGCIPAPALLEVLAHEHREDLHRMAGVLRETAGARHALEDPPWQRVHRRLPWLIAGFALSTGATALMAGFERALQANVAIAFFIPALVYLTDAIGTQTEAIVVRALSVQHRPLARLIVGEAVTGALIGAALGALAFLGVWLVFDELDIAIGVAVSLFAAGVTASILGLVLPWTFSRAGLDPAFGSGPVATIIQDVLTILIYFVTMGVLLA